MSQKINYLERDNLNIKIIISNTIKLKIDKYVEVLKLRIQQVKQISPNEILKKGYAIIRGDNNKILKNIESVLESKEVFIQMIDGNIKVFRKK